METYQVRILKQILADSISKEKELANQERQELLEHKQAQNERIARLSHRVTQQQEELTKELQQLDQDLRSLQEQVDIKKKELEDLEKSHQTELQQWNNRVHKDESSYSTGSSSILG